MSKINDLTYDIQEMYIEGFRASTISAMLECPIEMVYQVLESFGVEDNTSTDPYDTVNS
jgi:hypothetical protein